MVDGGIELFKAFKLILIFPFAKTSCPNTDGVLLKDFIDLYLGVSSLQGHLGFSE